MPSLRRCSIRSQRIKNSKVKNKAKPTSQNKQSAQEYAGFIYEYLLRAIPDPRCELYYLTPYQLLVAVVLSAHSTDKSVNSCTTPLYNAGFTAKDAVDLGIDKIREKIKKIGLSSTKAKNVYHLSQIILNQHGGEVPRTREALEALPGVGRKTANVVLGELFQEPTLAVDTHVFRVTQRLGIHNEKTPEKCEIKLLEFFPISYLPKIHHLLVLHGRYTCKALNPKCVECVLNIRCPSAGKLKVKNVRAEL